MPDEPYVSFPGCAFASAMNSRIFLAATDGCTASTLVDDTASVTGSKSLMGSNGSFWYRLGLMARAAMVPIRMV